MRSRAAIGDQFVAHAARERKVGDPVAVQVPELASAEAELDATEAMRPGGDAWPAPAWVAGFRSAVPGRWWVMFWVAVSIGMSARASARVFRPRRPAAG